MNSYFPFLFIVLTTAVCIHSNDKMVMNHQALLRKIGITSKTDEFLINCYNEKWVTFEAGLAQA